MLKSKSHIFRENRLVFLNEKPAGSPSESTEKPTSPGESLLAKAKKRFTEAKQEAFKSVQAFLKPSLENTPPKPTATAEVKPLTPQPEALPKLPEKPTGLHIDAQKTQINPDKKEVTHHFQFGDDKKISGHITMPTDSTPDGKTTYVFHYSDHPDQQDNKDLLTQIQKHRDKLGNTVVITLQTPTGETVVDGKKVESLTHLLGSLEAFQKQAQNDPRLKGLQLPVSRASNIFHLASTPEDQTKAASLLDNLLKKSPPDSRFTKDTRPHDLKGFIKILEQASQNPPPVSRPEHTTNRSYSGSRNTPISTPSSTNYSQSAAASSSSPQSNPSTSSNPDAPISTPHLAPTSSNEHPVETPAGHVDKALVLGDSIMAGAERGLKINDYRAPQISSEKDRPKAAQNLSAEIDQRAVGGWATNQILALFNRMDQAGRLERYHGQSLVLNGGVNDLANGRTADEILSNFQKIFTLAAKHNIRVYCCTILPFKGADGWKNSLKNGYETKENYRQTINTRLTALAASDDPARPYRVIELHKPRSQGGLADDNDPQSLAPEYAGGDKLHLSGKGNTAMIKAIQDIIGMPITPQDKTTENLPIGPTRAVSAKEYGPSDVQACEAYKAEILRSANPNSHIGEKRRLHGNLVMVVAWHQNHTGQWGTPSYQETPGQHIGVQLEKEV